MAIGITALTSGSTETDLSTFTSTSFAPDGDACLLAYVVPGKTDGSTGTPTSVTGFGLTWTLVDSDAISSNNLKAYVYYAVTPSSPPGSDNLSVNFSTAQHNASWHVLQLTGVDTADPIVQSNSANGTQTLTQVTLPGSVDGANAVVGFMAMNTNTFSWVAGSGYTLIGTEQGRNSPTQRTACEYDLTGTSNVIVATTGGTAPRIILGVEVAVAPIAGMHFGSASGTLSLVGAVTGARASVGSASGTLSRVGQTTGARMSIGAALGTLARAGQAHGARRSLGAAVGALTRTGSATGARVSLGSAAGTVTRVGAAFSARPARGHAYGTLNLSGSASGKRIPKGFASGVLTWLGNVTGIAPLVRVLTPTPPEQTYVVPREPRVLTVTAESRTVSVYN